MVYPLPIRAVLKSTVNSSTYSEEEMCELADIPAALANSVEIAKRCNVTIRLYEIFPTNGDGRYVHRRLSGRLFEKGLEKRLEFLFPNPEVRAENGANTTSRYRTQSNQPDDLGCFRS